MNFDTIKTAGKTALDTGKIFIRETGMVLRKKSPMICVIAGTGGLIASIFLACKATKKHDEVKKVCTDRINDLHATKENCTPKAYRHETVRVYGQNGMAWTQLYAPTAAGVAVSTGLIFFGVGLLNKRLTSVISAAAITENGFAEYRRRVIEKYGCEADDYFRLGIEQKEVSISDAVNKEGNSESSTSTFVWETDRKVIGNFSHYARYYAKDTAASTWVNDPAMNLTFLEGRERWLNQKLRTEGFMVLNDVYRELGLEASEAGCTVGWIYDSDSPTHMGDNCIDFGLFGEGVRRSEMREAYLEGDIDINDLIIDFNVDGVIANKIGHKF